MTIVNACFRSPDKPRGAKPYVITRPITVTSTSPRIQPRSSSTPNDNNNVSHRNNNCDNHHAIQRNGYGNNTHHKLAQNRNGISTSFEDKYLTPRTTTISNQYRFETDKRDGHVVCCDHAGQTIPLNGFRSSMLWNDSGISTDEDINDVIPTFPENRYQKSLAQSSILTKTEACTLIKEKLNESPQGLMKICLDVSRYAPNEIVIKLMDRKLHVEGKHFEETELGNDSCYFHRYFPIPDGTLPGDISSRITPNGVLTIRAQTHVYKPETTPTRHARFPSDGSSSSETMTSSSHAPTRSISSSHSQRLNSQSSTEHRRSFYDNIDLNASSTSSSATTTTTATTPSVPHQRHVSFKSTPDECDDCEFIEINNDHYQLDIDVRGYSPEDLRVKVIGKDLIVEGRRKCEVQTSDGRQLQTDEFKKTFRLPSGINIDTMCSRVTSKGVLKVEVWKSISEINKGYILPK